jgi:hypothetical protein
MCRILNISQPYGPPWPGTRIAFHFTFTIPWNFHNDSYTTAVPPPHIAAAFIACTVSSRLCYRIHLTARGMLADSGRWDEWAGLCRKFVCLAYIHLERLSSVWFQILGQRVNPVSQVTRLCVKDVKRVYANTVSEPGHKMIVCFTLPSHEGYTGVPMDSNTIAFLEAETVSEQRPGTHVNEISAVARQPPSLSLYSKDPRPAEWVQLRVGIWVEVFRGGWEEMALWLSELGWVLHIQL